MELMLDTANLAELREYLPLYPVAGITSNPTILKREGRVDFWAHMRAVRAAAGGRSLHVQVTAAACADMVEEADRIRAELGEDTYVKIPISEQGLQAVGILSTRGVNVTATAVYTTMQGILAALAGARYVALYYNRMQNVDIDAPRVVKELSALISQNGSKSRILAASFKNVGQVVTALSAGAHSVTVPPALLREALGMPSIAKAAADFGGDWEAVHGEGSTLLSV